MGPKSTYSPTALERRQRQASVLFSVNARLGRCDLACEVRYGAYGVYGANGIGLARLKTARFHAEMSEWVGRDRWSVFSEEGYGSLWMFRKRLLCI
jgi:hypothetical protein